MNYKNPGKKPHAENRSEGRGINAGKRFSPSWETGLSATEVMSQQKAGLRNSTPEKITQSNGQIIRGNVLTLFNLFNFIIAICLAAVHSYSNIAFLSIIILNICIGIVQEIHAKNLVEKLSLVTMPKAAVIRDGKEAACAIEELVQDDVVVFDMGKQICVDSIVLHGEAEVNESLLTGESDPVLKHAGGHLLSGSFVVSGRCYAQVEHVGLENYASKIAHDVKKYKAVNSRLLRSMQKVTRFTGFFIVPLGLLLFVEAYFFRFDALAPAVVSTSAGLLGMLPKGLVLLISITLATGVIKLSKEQVLVQNLFSLESLAYVDVLCLDKTGTLTEGKMSVQSVDPVDEASLPVPFEDLIGSFLKNSDDNNATFQALNRYFSRNGYFHPICKVPFSSQRKWSAMTFQDVGTLVIGAPDRLTRRPLPPKVSEQENSGARILMAAFTKETIANDQLPALSPVAFLTISDPIRKDAAKTLDFFEREGVDIKIISGDNPVTVSAIAKSAGLKGYDSVVDMSPCETDEQIDKAAKNYSVFGRVSPYQKRKLIQSFKKQGKTVAMTGDGVNDVLALREADCSIAMSEGSDATRQVSQLVLLNSDFTFLPNVLAEGRRAVNNVTRVAGVFFVKTVYSVLMSIACMLLNIPFPFIPLQITLIDMIIEGYPSFFMSFEPDNHKITETFLHSALRRAFPNALAILADFFLVLFLAPAVGISFPNTVLHTVLYVLVGFTEILAVYKSCLPFNKLRIFLCGTMTAGFFAAAFLSRPILQLAVLPPQTLPFIACLALVSMLLERAFSFVIDRLASRRA